MFVVAMSWQTTKEETFNTFDMQRSMESRGEGVGWEAGEPRDLDPDLLRGPYGVCVWIHRRNCIIMVKSRDSIKPCTPLSTEEGM